MYDYSTYLGTVAASAPLHGLFKVEQIEGDGVHTTTKKPVGEHGVRSFDKRADEIEVPENHLLGRRFGLENIIGIDCDGWNPSHDWTNGTGYYEVSAYGTGCHFILRVAGFLPLKNKHVISKDKAEAYGLSGEVELFLGDGNGIALTGVDAESGDIDLDASSDCARFLYGLFEDLQSEPVNVAIEGNRAVEASADEPKKKIPIDIIFKDEFTPLVDWVLIYAVPDNHKIPSNPSKAMMWVSVLIASRIREIEVNLGRTGLLRFDVVVNLWRHTEIYKQYYKDNPKYANYEEKERLTIEKCISKALAESPITRVRRSIKETCMFILNDKKKEITYEDKNGKHVNRIGFFKAWQREMHTTMIADTTNGSVWYDGDKWIVDGTSIVQQTELDGCLNRLSGEGFDHKGKYDVRQVASMKGTTNSTISIDACYSKGLTCKDGTIIIDSDGLHIREHDPFRDVWFGSLPASIADVTVSVEEEITWSEKKKEFKELYPKFFHVLDACGDDKVDLFASLAGVAIYYTMPNHKPLDCWYYLWDANVAGTGKSTHMKMFTSLFGDYVASGMSWKTFVGADSENSSLMGKIGCVCEEAGLNEIRSIEAIKSRTSGGWELKKLFQDKVGINEPLLMISLGNIKPLLKQNANTPAIWDRLQPCEFTIKHRNTNHVFDCSKDEYHKALLNIGCWVAYQLTLHPCKSTLPYHMNSEEVRSLCNFIPFRELIPEMGTHAIGKVTPLSILFKAIKNELRDRGFSDLKGAPELKSEESFKTYLDNTIFEFREPDGDYKYKTVRYRLSVKGANGIGEPNKTKRSFSRYWVENYYLKQDYYGDDEWNKYQKVTYPNTTYCESQDS